MNFVIHHDGLVEGYSYEDEIKSRKLQHLGCFYEMQFLVDADRYCSVIQTVPKV